jgi:hypothetical protein
MLHHHVPRFLHLLDAVFQLLDPILHLADFESDESEFAGLVAIGRLR